MQADQPAHPRRRLVLALVGRLLVIVVAALAILTAAGAIYVLSLPGVGDARARAARIMAAHHESGRALPTPRRLVAAVVSVEDEHFYDNIAINVLSGAGRAALDAVETGQDPGGSTIDQQLATLLYGHSQGVLGKLRDIGLGVKLALTYSHEQILAMYLNLAYYGHGYWGVTAAAQGYFETRPADLSWSQAAMLAGLLQAPSVYDPFEHYALARQRQDHVLAQLVANGYLTRSRAAQAYASPLSLG